MEILLVSGDSLTLKLLGFLLQEEGYTVSVAPSPREGLSILYRQHIDLVLLDVTPAPHTGPDLGAVSAVREAAPGTPILLLLARGTRADKIAALQAGADDCLIKPFDPAEVAARVFALVRRTHEVLAPELQTRLGLGPLYLDVRAQTALNPASGAAVPLTHMEVQLLHLLLRSAGRVLAPEDLIRQAWGEDYEGSSNQLQVYIHRLRGKLRSIGVATDLIHTVRGGGYEVTAPVRGETDEDLAGR